MACGKECGKLCKRGIYCKFVTVCPHVCCSIREKIKNDGVIIFDVVCGYYEMTEENKQRFFDCGYRLSSDEAHLILELENNFIELEIFKGRAKDDCPYRKKA